MIKKMIKEKTKKICKVNISKNFDDLWIYDKIKL